MLSSELRSVDDLQRRLSGYVLTPRDDGYDQAITIDNGRINQRPAFVVLVNSIDDVALSLRYARASGLPFTVRGGGHSANGYCLNTGGMVIDLSLMNAMSLNLQRKTVTVQMGARWNDVYLFLMHSGTNLIPIGGGCPTVGIPGFMQGGGYSFVSRSYGMSVDNLISITMVTADGKVRVLRDDAPSQEDCDLFWACRGGGGGNFGIAVEMKIQVHEPRTPKMLMAQLRYDPDQAQEVLGFYNDWVETLPNELAVYGIWGHYPDPADFMPNPKSIEQFGFTCVYNGEQTDGLKLIEPLLSLRPLTAQLSRLTLPEFEELNGRTTLVARRDAYIRAGMMPPGAFRPQAISVFQKYMASSPSQSSFLVWTHAGGQIETVSNDATSFAHRKARFVPELKSIWESPAQARANVEWAWNFFNDLEPYFEGSYVNYIDPLLSNWARKYYGANYDRLLDIKHRIDPENVFRFQQSVGSPFEPVISEPLDLSPLNRTFVE